MKRLIFSKLFILSFLSTMGAIEYNVREYVPKGKNYNLLNNKSIINFYFKPSKEKECIWLLYAKGSNNNFYLTGIAASANLEQKVPLKVMSFIGRKILYPKVLQAKSIETIKDILKRTIEKALDKNWLNAITNDAQIFVNSEEYNRNYAGFDMNYYEFFPIEKNDLTNPTSIENKVLINSCFKDDKLMSERILLEKSGVVLKFEDSELKKPDFDKNISWQKFRYDNLLNVVNSLKGLEYHDEKLKISDWPQQSVKNWGFVNETPTDFHSSVDSTCKYLMILQPTLKKRELMPTMAWKQNYGNWKATRCNLFVGDFAMQKLKLSTYPWGTTGWNANVIYDQLPKNEDFVLLDWNEAWFYASIGYPVFITTPKPANGPAAHIGFAYPISLDVATQLLKSSKEDAKSELVDNKIGMTVQTGAKIGKMPVAEGFGNLVGARIYVYLGYLVN